ncbi:MAG: 4Fe-4S dicluster domain-containing protein [Rikenellaceae bacterium]
MKFKKPKEVLSLEIITEKCTGCGACVKKCKREVFKMDKVNRVATIANLSDCVGCGKCIKKMCNNDAIVLILAKK